MCRWSVWCAEEEPDSSILMKRRFITLSLPVRIWYWSKSASHCFSSSSFSGFQLHLHQYLAHFLAVSGSVLHCRTWVCNVFKLQCETEGTSKPSTGCYFTLHVTFKYLLSLWVMIHCLLRSKPDLCFMNFMASLKNIPQLGRMSQHVQVNNN